MLNQAQPEMKISFQVTKISLFVKLKLTRQKVEFYFDGLIPR